MRKLHNYTNKLTVCRTAFISHREHYWQLDIAVDDNLWEWENDVHYSSFWFKV